MTTKLILNISDDIFSKAIITVLPDADKKDSLYWTTAQTIPNTTEEELAYERIDSLQTSYLFLFGISFPGLAHARTFQKTFQLMERLIAGVLTALRASLQDLDFISKII